MIFPYPLELVPSLMPHLDVTCYMLLGGSWLLAPVNSLWHFCFPADFYQEWSYSHLRGESTERNHSVVSVTDLLLGSAVSSTHNPPTCPIVSFVRLLN